MAHEFGAQQSSGGGGSPAIQPSIPSRPAATAAVLPHAPTPLFFLRWHPARWQLVDGEWLPMLGTLKLDLGAGGVDKDGNIDHAVIDGEKRGWTVIPWEVIPDGYVRAWPCRNGQYHCTKWETPRHMAGRVLSSEVDDKGYRDFLRMLVEQEIVKPADPAILEQIHIDQQAKRVAKLVSESHKPGVIPLMEAEQKKLADMKVATDKLKAPRGKGKRAEAGA